MISTRQHDGDADDRVQERIKREAEERRRLGLPKPVSTWKPPNPDLDIWGKPKKKKRGRRSKTEYAKWM